MSKVRIYLGEVQTTRQIKKLVFDGTESGWRKGSTFFFNQELSPDYLRARGSITCMCSHYSAYQQVGSGADVPEGYCSLYYALEVQRFYIKDSNFATLEDFTTYLAQQYAAGTPVTVWYVLATPQTAVVNEPLMKIGDYADSLTTSIPCTAGSNTLDVQTTVQPSEVTAGFSGWHPVTDVHEKSRNLFDESTIEVGGLDINTGAEVATSSRRRSGFIKVTQSTTYTLSRVIDETKSNLWVIGYDANKNVISDSSGTRPTVLTSIGENSTVSVFDTTTSTEYIRWYVTANGSYSDIMLNTGSTPLPYEPYWK